MKKISHHEIPLYAWATLEGLTVTFCGFKVDTWCQPTELTPPQKRRNLTTASNFYHIHICTQPRHFLQKINLSADNVKGHEHDCVRVGTCMSPLIAWLCRSVVRKMLICVFSLPASFMCVLQCNHKDNMCNCPQGSLLSNNTNNKFSPTQHQNKRSLAS